jgi:hypothetical protein
MTASQAGSQSWQLRENELARYKDAMANPANREIRGLEIVTNGKDSAAYWQSMMAMTGTTGSTRYVP